MTRPTTAPAAEGAAGDNGYGRLDRLVHRVAFALGGGQRAMAGVERWWCRRELAEIELQRPVLIAALPRAGTTILFELLAATSTFASHTYRDLPFVLCPLFGDWLSRPFRRPAVWRERMHGDGLQISLDSPAALEEVVWRRFWPEQYRGGAIEVWERCARPEFIGFLADHMRKIVTLRARTKPTARRYLSKNNANLARLPAIWDAVSDAELVVLFRDPLQHAASLLRQHRRFSSLHARDRFARRYMADLGHFEFGLDLRPINFAAWYSGRSVGDADQLAFWLDYWVAAYRHVLECAGHDRVHLVGFEGLVGAGSGRSGGPAGLGRLAEALSLASGDELQARAAALRAPPAHEVAASAVSAAGLAEARQLHERLREIAVL